MDEGNWIEQPEAKGPEGAPGSHSMFLKAGLVLTVVGLALMDYAAWAAWRGAPGGGVRIGFLVGVALGQLGVAGVTSWYLARFQGSARSWAVLRLLLPVLTAALLGTALVRLSGGTGAPFLVQLLAGTLLALMKMGFTAAGVVLILQTANETYVRRRVQ